MGPFFGIYRVTPEGERVDGVFTKAFIHNGDYHLTNIFVYRDGMVDCWGLVTFEEFQQKVRSGWVVTQPPPNARINISFLGSFKATDAAYWIEPEEFIREVADKIEGLNNRPTSAKRCREAWAAYQAAPSDETKEALRTAYEQIPKHNRRYVLRDQDFKDRPIRRVLYPEQYRHDL